MRAAVLVIADDSLVVFGKFGDVPGKSYAQYLVYISFQQLDTSQLVGPHNPWYLLQHYINCFIPPLGTESCGQCTVIMAA
jgi:hypothetical protein